MREFYTLQMECGTPPVGPQAGTALQPQLPLAHYNNFCSYMYI